MGDYSDFVEQYGFSEGDSEALNKIMSIWENDEIEELYSKEIINANTKKITFSKIKTIGFNNFKPYGEKLQKFSNKPITLVYGPNSIGKSSFIHMQTYIRYIFQTQKFDLINTNMFGDNINLGGFGKFIHKRDKQKAVTLEFEFEDCSKAIIEYLDLKNYSDNILKAISLFDKNEIKVIINNSENYIYKSFENTLSNLNGYVSIFEKDRNLNQKCNYISRNTNYENQEYKFSRFYKNASTQFEQTKNLNLSQMDSINYLNNKDQFINYEIKELFVSDILIPYFINRAKYNFINSKQYEFHFSKEVSMSQKDIEKISIDTLALIRCEINKHKYLNLLKKQNIPLKIIIQIKNSFIDKVEYYVDNKTFLKFEYLNEQLESNINKIMDKHFTVNFELDRLKIELKLKNVHWSAITHKINILDYQYQFNNFVLKQKQWYINNFNKNLPQIFQNLPEELFKKIYQNDHITNSLHEKNDAIIFLSFKKGYQSIIGAFNDMLGFSKLQYIGPLRFYPERDSSFKELDSNISIMPDSQTSWSYLKNNIQLRDSINKWLKDLNKLKTPYEIKYRKLYDLSSIAKIIDDLSYEEIIEKYLKLFSEESDGFFDEGTYTLDEKGYFASKDKKYMFAVVLKSMMKQMDFKEELVFEDLRNGTQISNRDLGLGISQILPVLIATNNHKSTTIAIEQPELHLHPAVQCELADEFIRSYRENRNDFIIETHSEHLLLRIMKRMRHTAEGKVENKLLQLTPNDVCLLYVDSNREGTFIRELELDNDGSLLDPWPGGFFEEGYKERFS